MAFQEDMTIEICVASSSVDMLFIDYYLLNTNMFVYILYPVINRVMLLLLL